MQATWASSCNSCAPKGRRVDMTDPQQPTKVALGKAYGGLRRAASGAAKRAASPPRLAVAIDRDRRSRWRGHLHMVHLAAKCVGHVPPVGMIIVRDSRATLDVVTVDIRLVTAHVRANGRTCDRA